MALSGRHCRIALATAVYLLTICLIPLANKRTFSGSGGDARAGAGGAFPFPIATAFLQLALVALVLALASACGRLRAEPGDSWVLGPHAAYKLRYSAPLGLFLGLKSGFTNWGLSMVPTGTHLLLSSTEIIWTVVTARFWNKERLSALDVSSALSATLGSVLISLHAGQTMDAPLLPLLVNCAVPLVVALNTSTLREGALELLRPDNRLRGTMSAVEFTCWKSAISAVVMLAWAMALEGGVGGREAWWTGLQRNFVSVETLCLVVGAALVLVFHLNLTWLASLTTAATVGIVGGIKVAPQWLLDAALQGGAADLTPLNVGGALLVVGSSLFYALGRWRRRPVAGRAGPLLSGGGGGTPVREGGEESPLPK